MLAASLVAIAVFLAGGPGFSWTQLVAKLVPVAALMIRLALPKSRYGRAILAGLALSLAGDALLALPGDLFLPGLIAFLLAHLSYIAAFIGERRKLLLSGLAPFLPWVVGIYLYLYPNLGALAAPVGIYCLVICAMMWRAAATIGRPAERWQVAAFSGAVLFGLSDTILALMRFQGGFPYGGAVLILAYWGGQSSIAISAVLHEGLAKDMPPVKVK